METVRLKTNHQLDCFAVVTRKGSLDLFVCFANRSLPRNDGQVYSSS